MAVSAVWRLVYFLATLPIGTKGADRSTQARRAVPLSLNPKASGFWYQSSQISVAPARETDHGLPGLAVKK
jgi:hypothetical protein